MEEHIPDDPKADFNQLKNHFTDYLKNRVEYFRLSVIETIAKSTPPMVLVALVSVFGLIFWIFVNIAAIIALGAWCENIAAGYLIMCGVNLLIVIILIVGYNPMINKPVSDLMVKILTDSKDTDENK
jgi:predicted RND superfamily exporter protein